MPHKSSMLALGATTGLTVGFVAAISSYYCGGLDSLSDSKAETMIAYFAIVFAGLFTGTALGYAGRFFSCAKQDTPSIDEAAPTLSSSDRVPLLV